jgi:2-oxoglutarate dehydrogenase complex dehydrogenase (E1) component-like enzyme
LDAEKTLRLLDRLTYAVEFEAFLATKYNTTKRFGLEGLCPQLENPRP